MKNLVEQLNSRQKAAVLHVEGPLAIIAGAGSGKTKTLTTKIAYLVKTKKISPDKILAVTFTNKAANEMKERVVSVIGVKGNEVNISTYHSMCVKILRQEISVLGYPSRFNILDTDDQKKILSSVYKEKGYTAKTLTYNMLTNYISKSKVNGKTPEDEIRDAETDTDRVMADIYDGYVKKTKKFKSLDFNDLLIFTRKILYEFPKIAKKWESKFKYILIDEFQDTSLVQYEIIKKLSKGDNLTIVGDPDQTIYSWRGADDSLITNFKKKYKKATIIKLEENYRSTKQILDIANKLIENNPGRIDKKLFTSSKDEGLIDFFYGRNDTAEARWIASKIKELKKERNQLKDIAILYRAQYVSQAVERALIEENINYVVYGGVKFYEREEIKDLVSYLKIFEFSDEISFERMLNKPTRGLGSAAIKKIRDWADQKDLGIYEALLSDFNNSPISKTQQTKLAKYLNVVTKFRVAVRSNPLHKVLDLFIQEVDYLSIWKKEEDAARFENIREFIVSIKTWEEKWPNKTLSDFLEEIALYIDQEKETVTNDYVRLMTVHAAKGLEFKHVFIAAFSETVFPSHRSLQEGGDLALEEERRLAYVAITRAMKNLYISSSRGYTLDFKTQKKPSRFFYELGLDVQDYTTEFVAPKNLEDNYRESTDIVEGDKVAHPTFGEGIVVNISGALATIAFKNPHGEKTLMKNHKTIERIS